MLAYIPVHFSRADSKWSMPYAQQVKLWLHGVIASEGFTNEGVTCVWCSDEHLRNINIQYLNHPDYTDVITFNYGESGKVSGDIFISTDRVRENASHFGTGVFVEMHRVMVHGVLHLCGYSDKTPSQKREMTEKEDFYLSLRTF